MKFELGDKVIHIARHKVTTGHIWDPTDAVRIVIGRGMMETISGNEEMYVLSGMDSSNRVIREYLHAQELQKVD